MLFNTSIRLIPHHYKIALGELGQAEKKGADHNKRILEYLSATTVKPDADEIPWCAAFVNWVLKQAGFKGTNSALARSLLETGEWIRRGQEREGDLVILKRGTKPWQGHVGFFVCDVGSGAVLLGGNQSDKVCFRVYPWEDLLGIRRPVHG